MSLSANSRCGEIRSAESLAQPNLTLDAVRDAVIAAAKWNPDSHPAELSFADALKNNNVLLPARLRRARHMLAVCGCPVGGRVLDAGCGIGLNSVLAVVCGVGHVTAVDMEVQRLRSAKFIIAQLGLEDRITLIERDLLSMEIESDSLDAVYSCELLEHIADLPGLYRRFHPWLKINGTVYARTGANGRNCLYRRVYPKRYDELDQAYVPMRRQIVEVHGPRLSTQTREMLVQCTRGLLKDEIAELVREYVQAGRRPQAPPRLRPPRNPHTGEFMERLLDPAESAQQIDNTGFRTEILPIDVSSMTFANPAVRFLLGSAGRIIRHAHPRSLFLSPWLEIRSVKVSHAATASTVFGAVCDSTKP